MKAAEVGTGFLVVAMLLGASSGCVQKTAITWQTVDLGQTYSIEMPAQPTRKLLTHDTPAGEVKMELFELNVDGGARSYGVSIAELPEVVAEPKGKEIDQRLENAQAGSLANTKARLLKSKKVTRDGYPGRDFTGELPDLAILRSQIYLVDRTVVQTIAVNVNSKDVAQFFDSLKLRDGAGATKRPTTDGKSPTKSNEK